jgi:hypothetical protein
MQAEANATNQTTAERLAAVKSLLLGATRRQQ